MSDAAPTLSLLEQFKQQRDAFVQQSAQIQAQFQQLQGAIFACNEMIAKIEKETAEQKDPDHKDNENEPVSDA